MSPLSVWLQVPVAFSGLQQVIGHKIGHKIGQMIGRTGISYRDSNVLVRHFLSPGSAKWKSKPSLGLSLPGSKSLLP